MHTQLKIETSDDRGRLFSYCLPGNYVCHDPDNQTILTWTTSADAAFGLQLLHAQDPMIPVLMSKVRKDPKAWDKAVVHIDTLQPDIHNRLNDCAYKWQDFTKAAAHIIQTFYDSDAEKALEVAINQDYQQQLLVA